MCQPQNYCCPPRNSCCEIDECCSMCCRSFCECIPDCCDLPKRLQTLPTTVSSKAPIKGKKPIRTGSKKLNSNMSTQSVQACESRLQQRTPSRRYTAASNPKHLKNERNYQCQDLSGQNHMDVINEEREEAYERDKYADIDAQSKKIQDSCADFLNIVHDTLLETVKRSTECVLRDYFVHTLEKIECLNSQMMRNECLLSKMYLDIMDKISQQGEKSLKQYKCMCKLLTDTRKACGIDRAKTPNDFMDEEELSPGGSSPPRSPQRSSKTTASVICSCPLKKFSESKSTRQSNNLDGRRSNNNDCGLSEPAKKRKIKDNSGEENYRRAEEVDFKRYSNTKSEPCCEPVLCERSADSLSSTTSCQ